MSDTVIREKFVISTLEMLAKPLAAIEYTKRPGKVTQG
jgi:hypothetical protein